MPAADTLSAATCAAAVAAAAVVVVVVVVVVVAAAVAVDPAKPGGMGGGVGLRLFPSEKRRQHPGSTSQGQRPCP